MLCIMLQRSMLLLLMQFISVSSFAVPGKDMSPVKMNPLKFAVDISYAVNSSQMNCFFNSGYQAVVIRVADTNGNFDSNALSSIGFARSAGLAIEIYMYVSATSSVLPYDQFESVYDSLTNKGFNMKRIWIVVDQSGPAWYADPDKNVAVLTSLFNRITSYGVQPGIFTNHKDWNGITASNFNIAAYNIFLWYTPYSNTGSQETPTDFSDFHPIGSSNTPVMKRYQWGEYLCGLTGVNRNVFDPSLITPLSTLLPMATFTWDTVVTTAQFNCFSNNNYNAVIVRITGSTTIDTTSVPTINNAFNANVPIELYMEIVPTSSTPMTQQFQNVYDYLRSNGIRFSRIWILVSFSAYFGTDTNQNVAAIQSFIQRANQFKVEVGIFTTADTWAQITGSYTGFAATSPLWYSSAHYVFDTYNSINDFSDYKPFGNWNYPTMKTFSRNSLGDTICGENLYIRVVFNSSLPIGQYSVVRI